MLDTTNTAKSPGPSPLRAAAAPSPYELYIRLASLSALWPSRDEEHAWQGEVTACCGLQAVELTLRLLEGALQDRRASADGEQRVERMLAHVTHGLRAIYRLLRDLPAPPDEMLAAGSPPLATPGYAVLTGLSTRQIDELTSAVEQQCKPLSYRLGIEQTLHALRLARGLDPLSALVRELSRLDYGMLVSPHVLWNAREPEPCGPEDHLFSTAHQICECWLVLVHDFLRIAQLKAADGAWLDATRALASGAEVMPLVIEAGQLLDLMVLADYHPLRVRLRDGSGAQSNAAQQLGSAVQDAAQPLWAALDACELTLLDVLERPVEHVLWHRYVQGLKRLGKQVQSFLFQHYLLALGVLGTTSLGSLGYSMSKLAERAARPVLPRIDQAHHDYVMLTNFRHGASSGAIIQRNEELSGYRPPLPARSRSVCDPGRIAQQVERYFTCIHTRDAAGWVALFAPEHGELRDVLGTRPYRGAERLTVFIQAMFQAFTHMSARLSELRVEGQRASVDWHFEATSYAGLRTAFGGREEFVFDERGQIVLATAHWNPAEVAAQWERAGRASPRA